MKILVVEDNGPRTVKFQEFLGKHDLTITKSSKEGCNLSRINKYDVIFLDHDLGIHPDTGEPTEEVFLPSKEWTGYEVAQAIAESPNAETPVIIHSWNLAGGMKMRDVLKNAEIRMFGTPEFHEVMYILSNKE